VNPWQMAQQIKHKLTTVAWPGGSAEVVFGTRSVHVFAGTPTEEQIPPGFPWCLVGVDAGTPDDDHPEFIEQGFSLTTGVDVAGDPLGEFSLIGSSVGDLGKSPGRGILEVAERVRSAVESLTGADGAKIQLTSVSTGAPAVLASGRHLALDELGLTALCTSRLHYAAPQQITLTGNDGFTWAGGDLNGDGHCSERFDFKQYRLYESDAAITAPVAEDLVATVTVAAATHTAVQSSVYTVFADYNSRDTTGSVVGTSSVEVGSSLIAP